MGIFMYDNDVAYPDYMTLTQLDILFKDDNTVYNYEGAYNTFNFIKDRFYAVGCNSIFQDYDDKKAMCRLKLGDIAKYILDIKSGTKLKLSIGESDLIRVMNNGYKPYRQSQDIMIEAFAFNTDLEKLELGNYEECKRLLYLPRNIRNK